MTSKKRKFTMDKRLLDILCDPVTKTPVKLLSRTQLDALNREIAQDAVKTVAGTNVAAALKAGLITTDGKVIYRMHPKEISQATKPTTAAELRAMMVKVVQSGTGTKAQIAGITVGGKTGTAEIGQGNVYDAWFIFFAPADHPKVAGAVVVESQPDGFGGAISAPIAKQLIEAALPAAAAAGSA